MIIEGEFVPSFSIVPFDVRIVFLYMIFRGLIIVISFKNVPQYYTGANDGAGNEKDVETSF